MDDSLRRRFAAGLLTLDPHRQTVWSQNERNRTWGVDGRRQARRKFKREAHEEDEIGRVAIDKILSPSCEWSTERLQGISA
jgi:hypothetical protein